MMIKVIGVLFVFWISWPVWTVAKESTDIDKLMGLDLTDLGEVEIKLDDVFDVFDSLIKGGKVSVATGEEQTIAKAPAITSVITSQDIEAMGAATLFEVLESVPGLHVSTSSLFYMPIYIFRGLQVDNNNHALVMVNGTPINLVSTRNQGTGWLGMQTSMISRIEVIRGPGSAVYGADAFSGVINIITKTQAEIDGTEVGLRVGSFDSYEGWLLHGDKYAGFDVAVMMEFQNTDGHGEEIAADGQVPFDKSFGTSASRTPGSVNLKHRDFNARLDVSKGQWRFRAGYQDRRNFGMAAGLNALDPIGRTGKIDRKHMELLWRDPYLTSNWDVSAKLSFYNYQRGPDGFMYIYPAGAFNGGLPEGMLFKLWQSENNTRFEVSGFYSGFENHLIRLGAGYHYADIDNWEGIQNFPPNRTEVVQAAGLDLLEKVIQSWYVNAQDSWSINSRWKLTLGIRYDRFKDMAESINPRAVLVWQTTPVLTTKILYGKAFRIPSVLELYEANPVGGQVGNPNLQPESIDWEELAFDWQARENLHFSLNLYAYQMQDAIDLLPIEGADYSIYSNVGEQDGYGFEFETRWKMTTKSSLLFNYAYQTAEDKAGDEPGYVPGQQAYVRADWMFRPNWFIDGQVNWVADRKRTADDPRDDIDDYTTVDLTLRHKNPRSAWNVAVSVRNLFDANVREPSLGPTATGTITYPFDYPSAGRSFFGEVRYQFK